MTPPRTYTVSEVEALREVVSNLYLYGSYQPDFSVDGGRMSRAYQESDKAFFVEQTVRTHMLAGHTADDLIRSENPVIAG